MAEKATTIVRLDQFPNDLHTDVRKYQIGKAEHGVKVNFPEACYDLIREGLKQKGTQK